MAGAAARGVDAGGYSTVEVEEVDGEGEPAAARALSASMNVDEIFTPLPLPPLPPTPPLTAALLLLTATRHSASEAYLPRRESAALPSARHQSRTSAHCASFLASSEEDEDGA